MEQLVVFKTWVWIFLYLFKYVKKKAMIIKI